MLKKTNKAEVARACKSNTEFICKEHMACEKLVSVRSRGCNLGFTMSSQGHWRCKVET